MEIKPLKLKFKKWIIMDKDRTVIAKGIPRNRSLVPLKDTEDKQRILDYTTKGRAEAGFTGSGFWDNYDPKKDPNLPYSERKYDLEAVPVEITIKEIKE
jgi:hypothetical protein